MTRASRGFSMSSNRHVIVESRACRAPRLAALAALSLCVLVASPVASRASCHNIPKADPSFRTSFLVGTANTIRRWEAPTEPVKIVDNLYFVGTKGLGVFLFATPEGHILMNTGMPSSGPMIVTAICKLGFKPEDIKIVINGHAHIDHAGAFSYFKKHYRPDIVVMSADVAAMRLGGAKDFRFQDGARFPKVEVDRILKDGDLVRLGGVELTAHHTPGHTPGATTWVTKLNNGDKPIDVVFPDGTRILPRDRLVRKPSYPGIDTDFRRTFAFLAALEPGIWLTPHNEEYDFHGKRTRAREAGVAAWIDADGYRQFINKRKQAFERRVKLENALSRR